VALGEVAVVAGTSFEVEGVGIVAFPESVGDYAHGLAGGLAAGLHILSALSRTVSAR
jgi:hypothetical protein